MKTFREEHPNKDADKNKIPKCFFPCPAEWNRPHIPCNECCHTETNEEEKVTIERVKGIKLLGNATLWRLNVDGEEYSSISVPTGSEYKTEEYRCLRENEDKLIEAYQALKTVQIYEEHEEW